MLRVVLTGGIATGKSHCLHLFAGLGVPTIDADVLAREAVGPGTHGFEAIVRRFGAGVLDAGGALDRRALARIVFGDTRARTDLEAIVHPAVYRRIRDFYADLPAGSRMGIADIPLVFETGQDHEFDRLVVAACSQAEQVRRIMGRDRLAEADARARIAAQWPIEEKVRRAHHVIWTDRGLLETETQVRTIYEVLNVE